MHSWLQQPVQWETSRSMNPRIRGWLFAGGSALLALWIGWSIANGSLGLAGLAAATSLAAILVRLSRLPLGTVVLGLLLIGYVVGNRGFAQIMPLSRVPLFPAELGLAVCLGGLIMQAATRRTQWWRNDALNWAVAIWLVLGTARVIVDVPRHGLMALRDYAVVYYAAYFFVAQHQAMQARAQRYLVGCLRLGVVVLLPVYFLFQALPEFFLSSLTLRGVPLVFLKGDLAASFLGAGMAIVYFTLHERHRFLGGVLAGAMFLTVVAGDSRASLAGVVVASIWLLMARRWGLPALQGVMVALALTALVAAAVLGSSRAAEARLQVLTDYTASLTDLQRSHVYSNEENAYKSDNNQFRLVWWGALARETASQAPVFGLGFGYDLARGFLQVYYPETDDDFTARSPHSIVMTAFGRMGIIGLAVLGIMVGAIALRTWQALRDRSTDPVAVGSWCAAWVILTSACFGVVLEGPMGAVVFWSVLGLASGSRVIRDSAVEVESSTTES
jgi:hypothetical protein